MTGLTMSSLYCLLTVLPSTLEALGILDQLPSKRLITNLHRFFSLSFWWPVLPFDVLKAWEFVHGSNISMYHRHLKILAANFVKSVDKFHRTYPNLATHVDIPNLQWLLELVQHTIPLFNHISYVCELVFEAAHQPLKYFLSRNCTLNSHVYSVNLVLAKDWMIRILQLWQLYNNERESKHYRQCALIGLARLFVGEDVDAFDWISPSFSNLLEEIRQHIRDLMSGTVEKLLAKWYKEAKPTFSADSKWVLQSHPKGHKHSSEQILVLDKARHHISSFTLQHSNELQSRQLALLSRDFGSLTKGSHEQLHTGDIVQVLVADGFEHSLFLASSITRNGSPRFFVIGGFLQCESDAPWAVVNKQCTLRTRSTLTAS